MSDLASGCEHYTTEKTCLAVAENPKAQSNRQLHCLNDDKQSCCYICDSRRECTISCKYLGATDHANPTQPKIENPPLPTQSATANLPSETKAAPDTSAAYCTSCNVEMGAKKARLKLEADTPVPRHFGDYALPIEEALSVIVYLCPLCGRIEFRANRGAQVGSSTYSR